MNSKQGLIPTLITDRNGKQTTVYTKPTTSTTPSTSIPAPAHSSLKTERKKFLAGIAKTIDEANSKYFGVLRLSAKVQSATNDELRVLADTLAAHPEFEETLQAAAAECNRMNWRTILSFAVIYNPDYAKEQNPQRRMELLMFAMEKAHEEVKGGVPQYGWDLASETPANRVKAKRYAAAWYILRSAEASPPEGLVQRLLDNTRTDHDETLAVLRTNPHATIEQIDFILSGGPAPLSSGTL